ncbi:hypothetical protein LTR09_000597 [Extremus antarcticus]|uniref:Heterokaryon incompatibility domain-containing protein n=1 Tax=Extremus antarcticus TaxID=702011 RepID=A0AAJ0GJX4_9PEZI|nr:hypothetical protein LTR09_000597 [Extremus antarcticus]
MWLLDVETRKLQYFNSERNVSGGYAILSHTWGDNELTFDHIDLEDAANGPGYKKIDLTCRQALKDGYRYAWIDTICIDKRSSAELSEAINSMFRWYNAAKVCYVYLQDVEDDTSRSSEDGTEMSVETMQQFRSSRWFTRAWTLQELIAPLRVLFYDRGWSLLGDKYLFRTIISDITNIDRLVLRDSRRLKHMSVAKRMSWAAKRSASREEDEAYALLGLFDVAMPMLYGEGGQKAFRRLQEEIIRTSGDHSILAWIPWDDSSRTEESDSVRATFRPELLSISPYGFRDAQNIVSWDSPRPETFELSYHGLRISLLTYEHAATGSCEVALNCRYEDEQWSHIVIPIQRRPFIGGLESSALSRHSTNDPTYDRVQRGPRDGNRFKSISIQQLSRYAKANITLTKELYYSSVSQSFVHVAVGDASCTIVGSHPPEAWDRSNSILSLRSPSQHLADEEPMRAAVIVSNPKALTATTGDLAVVISIGTYGRPNGSPVADRPCPHVLVLPASQFSRSKQLRSSWKVAIPPGQPRGVPLWDQREPALTVSSKYISASGEMLWSLLINPPPHKARDMNPRSTSSAQEFNIGPQERLRFDTTERAREVAPHKEFASRLFDWRG